jgi:hypothetical protein
VAPWQYFGASLDHLVLALCFAAFAVGEPELISRSARGGDGGEGDDVRSVTKIHGRVVSAYGKIAMPGRIEFDHSGWVGANYLPLWVQLLMS